MAYAQARAGFVPDEDAQQGCEDWCSMYTCEKIECETCDKCLELSGGGSGGNEDVAAPGAQMRHE